MDIFGVAVIQPAQEREVKGERLTGDWEVNMIWEVSVAGVKGMQVQGEGGGVRKVTKTDSCRAL